MTWSGLSCQRVRVDCVNGFSSPAMNDFVYRIASSSDDLPLPFAPSSNCFSSGLYSKLTKHRKLSMYMRVSMATYYIEENKVVAFSHPSVCTSTDNTAGRSRTIGAHESPASADA